MRKLQLLNACNGGIIKFLRSGLINEKLNEIKEIKIYREHLQDLQFLIKTFKLTVEVIFFNSDEKYIFTKGNNTRHETSSGFWETWTYDTKNNPTHYETSHDFCRTWTYDAENNLIYCEASDGRWESWKYDAQGNLIFLDSSEEFKNLKYEIIKNRELP